MSQGDNKGTLERRFTVAFGFRLENTLFFEHQTVYFCSPINYQRALEYHDDMILSSLN